MERWKKRSRRGERRILTVIAVITILIVVGLIIFYVWSPRISDAFGSNTGVTMTETIHETPIETATPTYAEPVSLTDPQLIPTDHPSEGQSGSNNLDVHTVDRKKMSFVLETPPTTAGNETE